MFVAPLKAASLGARIRTFPLASVVPRNPETYVVIGLIAAAFGIRLWYAAMSNLHEDEYYQAWAAATVAQTWTPKLASDVLYVHGVTVTYLVAPLYAIFEFNPFVLRLPSAVLGGLAVLIAFVWTRRIGGLTAGVIAAAFIGFEPHMIVWGGRIRMYQVLVLLALALGYATWRGFIQDDQPRWKIVSGVLAAFTLFTHFTGITLVAVPAIVVARHAITRKRLDRGHLFWLWIVGSALTFQIAHRFTTPPVSLAASGPIERGFALPVQPEFRPDRTLEELAVWLGGLATRAYSIPVLIAIGLWTPIVLVRGTSAALRPVAYPLLLSLVPLAGIALLSPEHLATPRYVLAGVGMLAPVIGLTFALPADVFAAHGPWLAGRALRAGTVAIIITALLFSGQSIWDAPRDDLRAAYTYLASNHGPDEAIVAQHPPIVEMLAAQSAYYLIPGLPTPEVRVKDGAYIDPWTGNPLAFRGRELCELLDTHDRVWIVALGGQLSRLEPEARVLLTDRFRVGYAEQDAGDLFGQGMRVIHGEGPCHNT
jgi:4-amino-4-deoxy-L-arabinose transferase-like glycosyltransferase